MFNAIHFAYFFSKLLRLIFLCNAFTTENGDCCCVYTFIYLLLCFSFYFYFHFCGVVVLYVRDWLHVDIIIFFSLLCFL